MFSFDEVKKNVYQKANQKKGLRSLPSSFKNQAYEKGMDLEDTGRKKMNDGLYDLRLIMNDFMPIAVQELFNVLLDPNTEPKDKLRCIEIIFNRFEGRPRERMEISSIESVDIPASKALASIEHRLKLMPPGPQKEELGKALKKTEKEFKNVRGR